VTTTNVVIGRVVGFHVKNAVYDKEKNRILLDKYKPVGRLGGVEYTRVDSIFELPRPYWCVLLIDGFWESKLTIEWVVSGRMENRRPRTERRRRRRSFRARLELC
jgi:hypothetical protein